MVADAASIIAEAW